MLKTGRSNSAPFKIAAPKLPWVLRSRSRLFVTLFFTLAIPAAILTVLVALYVRNSLQTHVIRQNSILARIVASNFEDQFHSLREHVEDFTYRTKLIEYVSAHNDKLTRAKLDEFLRISPSFSRAFVTDAEGLIIADSSDSQALKGRSFSDRDWFLGAKSRSGAYVSAVYSRTNLDNAPVVTISCRIQDRRQTIGYFGGQFTTERLAKWLTEIKPALDGSILVLDQHYQPAIEASVGENAIHRGGGKKDTDERPIVELNNRGEFLVSRANVSSIGWSVIVEQPTRTVFAPVRALIQTILGFFLVSFVAMALIGFFWLETIFKFEARRESADNELRKFAADLQRSNDELQALCYSIAHDLRGPLRAVRGMAIALREDYSASLDELGKDYVSRLDGSAKRMDELTHDLIEYGRLSHVDVSLERVSLEAAVEKTLLSYAEEVKMKNGTVEVKRPLPTVQSHQLILEQILANLVGNSLKFVSPGIAPCVRIWADISGNRVIVRIRDNGIGIDPAHHQRIFGVFERLHTADAFPGTGIGLAIVRKGIERIGGKVGVDSKPGEGSCFWIDLPRASEA